MEEISTIGIDIAKSVFQVHAISNAGEVVVRRQLKRRQVLPFFAGLRPCLIGMEATSPRGQRDVKYPVRCVCPSIWCVPITTKPPTAPATANTAGVVCRFLMPKNTVGPRQ